MAVLALIISVLAIFVVYVLAYYQWKNRKVVAELERRGIRYVSQSSFFKVLLLKQRLELERDEAIRREGKVFGFGMFGQLNLAIAELELIQLILSKEFTNFPNRRKFETEDPMFKNFLSTVDVDQWKRLRAIVAPTFATGKLRRMKPTVDSICRTLITNMENALAAQPDQSPTSPGLNIKQFAGAFTMDTVIQVAFGAKVDSLIEPNNPIIANAKKLFNVDISIKNIIAFALAFGAPKFLQRICNDYFRINGDVTDFFKELALDVIERKRKEFSANKNFEKAKTFIEFLLEAEHELQLLEKKQQQQTNNGNIVQANGEANNGKAKANGQTLVDQNQNQFEEYQEEDKKLVKYITNDEMIAQCVLFFLAGYDTTATAITLACYNLALNPDAQEKAYEDICRKLEELDHENDNSATGNKLESVPFEWYGSKFEYASAVVNETLRMIPPATFTERRAAKDMTLETSDGRYRVPVKKDDIIQISIWSLHYSPEYWTEPERFRPERFLKDGQGDQYPKYAFLPFGAGPRACVARSLALMEANMALVWLIYHFRFGRSQKTPVPLEFYNQGGFLSPRDVYLTVERRSV